MLIYVFFAGGALFLLAGLILIIRGIRPSDGASIVPISDLDQIKEFKSDFSNLRKTESEVETPAAASVEPKVTPPEEAKTSSPATSSPALTSHVLKQNLNKDTSAKTVTKKDSFFKFQFPEFPKEGASAIVTQDLAALQKENENLKEALRREISFKEMKTLSQEEKTKLGFLEIQYKQLEKSLERLTQENQKLVKEKSDNLANLTEWQELKIQHEKWQGTQSALEALTQKEQLWLNETKSKDSVIVDLESRLAKITQESQAHVRELHELRHTSADLQAQLITLKNQFESAQKQNGENLQLRTEFELNYNKMKGLNDHLLEKEKILQYELTKSRAQNLGLTKICDYLKLQNKERRSLSASAAERTTSGQG